MRALIHRAFARFGTLIMIFGLGLLVVGGVVQATRYVRVTRTARQAQPPAFDASLVALAPNTRAEDRAGDAELPAGTTSADSVAPEVAQSSAATADPAAVNGIAAIATPTPLPPGFASASVLAAPTIDPVAATVSALRTAGPSPTVTPTVDPVSATVAAFRAAAATGTASAAAAARRTAIAAAPPSPSTTVAAATKIAAVAIATDRVGAAPTVRATQGTQPERIVIPSLKLDRRVVEIGWEQALVDNETLTNVWETAEYAAGFHKGSATIGLPGNTVVSGHNNIDGAVFGRLHELEPGDRVYLYADDVGREYEVWTNFIVQEQGASEEERLENGRWIDDTPDERLTLVTCWPPWGNSHRTIVIARPVGPVAAAPEDVPDVP